MSIDDIFWDVALFLILFGGGAAGFIQHLQSRRHKFKIAMAKERAKAEQAKAKALEEQNRQTALTLRAAELEIERYDRRVSGLPPVPRLPSGVEADDIEPT